MVKTLRKVLILFFVAVFGSFIVLEALNVAGKASAAGTELSETTSSSQSKGGQNALLAKDYELGEKDDLIREPNANDIVTVLIQLYGAPMLEIANERGLTVLETYENFDGNKLLSDLDVEYARAYNALSGYIVKDGYHYTSVFNGFSAQVRYGDIAKIENNSLVRNVILSNTYEAPLAITENTVDVADTGIFNSEGIGFDGTGTVVAVLDTGTDYTHEVFDMELDPNTMALSKDDVAAAVPLLTATMMSAATSVDIDEDELYISSKLPYAYDYADVDTNVYPAEAHGTHVAGIIAGESHRIRGVAPRAQIATFKVFADGGLSSSEGILAAVNDAVVLGVDAINMSLGASCGFAREGDDDAINAVYDLVEESGVSLVVAAGNEYSSAYNSTHGVNLASNPDSGTVGSPGSYYASFSVASVSGVKTPYMIANGEKEMYFRESVRTGQSKTNKFVDEMLGDSETGSYDYVVIPGVGYEANYTGLDVKGKIAVVKRGSNSFEEKVKIAQAQGAVGVIIYNNVSGMLNMSVGASKLIPACLVSMDYGSYLVANPTGKVSLSKDYLAGPFMSDFSSWGPLPNLVLTPDITGHGGEITSSYPGGNEYDTISGTSMACPNIAGSLVLVREYVKGLEGMTSTTDVRDLSYNLMMSTATIVRNEEGNPYSPRKQGAGIGDIRRSVNTKAYLSVEGSNKAKLSLGDDPTRSGVYELNFNITNLSGDALSYTFDPLVMTESLSTDGKTVAEKAYMLNFSPTYAISVKTGEAQLSGNNIYLGGYAEVAITVTINLATSAKDYIDGTFTNGMYVEGYVVLDSNNSDQIDLNIPFLAFYGGWDEAPMLDVSAYEVGESLKDSSVLPEDKLVADVYGTLPTGGFYTTDDNGKQTMASWGLGAFGYNLAQGYDRPVTLERYASLTHNPDGNFSLYTIGAGLFRNAKRVDMEIRDSVTGELIWEKTDYNARKSHSAGGEQSGGYVDVDFDIRDLDLPNNSRYTFYMECYLDWGDGNQGNKNTFSFEFTIDDEVPVLLDTNVRDTGTRKTVEFSVHDNHYLQAFILYTYEEQLADGSFVGLRSISNGVIPVAAESSGEDPEFNGTTRVSFDVTSYWTAIQQNGGKLYVQFMDYAKNTQVFTVTLEECSDVKLEKTRSARDEYTVRPNGQLDLEQYVRVYSNVGGSYLENYWVKDLVWTSDNPEVVEVRDGLVTGLARGEATVTVTPADGGNSLTFKITVAGEPTAITVRGIELTDYSLRLERGEEFVVEATIEPYNYTGNVELVWTSSSANVTVTPDPDNPLRATVKGLKSGSATVSVQVKGTYINASCFVRVAEEFYVDGGYLRTYTGRGDENGVVEIPADLGVIYIYPYAFMNNKYITKIIIPEGVQQIMTASIYGCDNLEEIVLPESCKTLGTFSIGWNPKLKKINTENVTKIGSRAFVYDTALEEVDLSHTTFIDTMAFLGCSGLKSVDLRKVGIVSQQAFQNCTGLTNLVIPANTSLGTAAFYYCTNLQNVTIYSGNIGSMAFQNCTSLTNVTFIGDVNIIDAQAFYGCSSLKKVNFLGSVYEIGSLAFGNCSKLESFTLPAGLTKIGQQVFAGCTGIKTIKVDKDACILEPDLASFYYLTSLTAYEVEAGNKYLSSQDGVLYDKTMYRLIAYPFAKRTTLFAVPDSVRVIGPSAFSLNSVISRINLNNVERIEDYAFQQSTIAIAGSPRLTYIGAYAFSAASALTSLPISSVTTYIGDNAFANCTGLAITSLAIPRSVTHIGDFAFYNCPFRTITLGDGLEEVGYGAFSHCAALTTVNFGKTLRAIAPEMFASCTALTSIVIPDTIEEIGLGAFFGASNLSNVTILGAIEELPAYAFYDTAITSFQVPESVRYIGAYAFLDTKLSAFDFSHIEVIGAEAFEGTNLTSVTSDSVVEVGLGAFYNSKVATVSLPNAETIGAAAFADCTSLISVNLPSALTLGDRAFEGCTSLTNVKLGKVENIGNRAFANASKLSALELPNAQTLGAHVFEGTLITTLSLPALRSVANQAFSDARSLKAINVADSNPYFVSENGVLYKKNSGNFFTLVAYPFAKTDAEYTVKARTVKIGAYAFENNTYLTKITLPEHLKVLGAGAFFGMSALKTLEIKAVAAPTLESIATVDASGEMSNFYNNFKSKLGADIDLNVIVPENATGYDSYIWEQYLGNKIQANGKIQPNSSALDFIDRVLALSTLTGSEREEEITALERIYRLLNATQKTLVQGDYDGVNYYALLQAASTGNGAQTEMPIPEVPFTPGESPSGGGSNHARLWIVLAAVAVIAVSAVAVIVRVSVKRRK